MDLHPHNHTHTQSYITLCLLPQHTETVPANKQTMFISLLQGITSPLMCLVHDHHKLYYSTHTHTHTCTHMDTHAHRQHMQAGTHGRQAHMQAGTHGRQAHTGSTCKQAHTGGRHTQAAHASRRQAHTGTRTHTHTHTSTTS